MTLEEILQQSELDRMLSGNVRPYQNHAFSEYKPTFQEKSYDFINKYLSTPAAKSLVGNKGNFGLMDLTGFGGAAEQIARNTGRGINQENYGDVALGFGLLGLDVFPPTKPIGKIAKPVIKKGKKVISNVKNKMTRKDAVLRQQGLLDIFSNPTTNNPTKSGGLLKKNTNSVWNEPTQAITSADTSINSSKLPAAFTQLNKEGAFKKGSVNIDIGGGRFNNADDLLQKSDATNLVYDPFNRTKAHNANVVDAVSGGNADTATINNVLNVIDGEANQLKVLNQAKDAVKKDGEVFISVYQGVGDGVGKTTSKGFQQNKKTKDYLELVREVFPDAELKKGIIRATNK